MTDTGFERFNSRLWKTIAVRAVISLAFGVVLLAWPDIALGVMLYTFAAVAIADGCVAIWAAYDAAPKGERGWMGASGAVAIAIGVGVLLWPDMTATALLYVIGAWAIVTGGVELAEALIGPLRGGARLLLTLHGAIAMAFGVLMWIDPRDGALAVLTLVAAYAIVNGLALGAMAYEIHDEPERTRELLTAAAARSTR